MLFVALLTAKAGTPKERVTRRAQWQHPEGMKPIAEYWLQASDPTVISIFEADSVAPIIGSVTAWGDVFDICVYPAITAEEGLELAKKMM